MTHQLIRTLCLLNNHFPPNKWWNLDSTIWMVCADPRGACEDAGIVDYYTLEMIPIHRLIYPPTVRQPRPAEVSNAV